MGAEAGDGYIGGKFDRAAEQGVYISHPPQDPHLTEDYKNFAERQRARWDLVHYLSTVVKQFIAKLTAKEK